MQEFFPREGLCFADVIEGLWGVMVGGNARFRANGQAGSRGKHVLQEAGGAACSTAKPCKRQKGRPCPSWLACWLVSLQLAYRKAPIPIHCPLGAASSRGRVFQLHHWHNVKQTSPVCNAGKAFSKECSLCFISYPHCFSKMEWDGALSGVPVT